MHILSICMMGILGLLKFVDITSEEHVTNAFVKKMLSLSKRCVEEIIALNKQVYKTKNICKRQKKARTFFYPGDLFNTTA